MLAVEEAALMLAAPLGQAVLAVVEMLEQRPIQTVMQVPLTRAEVAVVSVIRLLQPQAAQAALA
jgi:hypothetical protein